MITGEGAGTAAALTLKNKCTLRSLDKDILQKQLKKQGAFIK
jgi:hypothetical protein